MVSSLLGTPLERCSGLSKATAKISTCTYGYPPPTQNIFQSIENKTSTISLCFSHHKSHLNSLLPLATSLALLLSSSPANAGFLSGSTGIESIPGPELPQIDSLARFNEENQKRYAENDARFKESPLLKQLLEKSKLNKEKNKQEIQDKYCLRGAEWGVGDCSTAGMSEQDREEFIAMLKKKAGVE